jgi:hypothetical protein
MATVLRQPAFQPPAQPMAAPRRAPQPATYAQARATGMPPPLAQPMGARTLPPTTAPAPAAPTRPPPPNAADAATNPARFPAPPGFDSHAAAAEARLRAEQQAKLDAYKAGGGVVPADALFPGDPRLQAGGGPHGWSNEYTDTGHGYYTYQEPQFLPPGWYGGPQTPQAMTPERKYAGHAQYDPELFALWKQQHPNDPRQYAGPSALPPELAAKWYQQKGRELWQQAVVAQHNQPNNGQQPLPQGGLAVSTPGIPAGDSPYWAQQGQKWYQQQGKPLLPPPKAPPPPRAPATSTLTPAQQTSLQQDIAKNKQGAKPGAEFIDNAGHHYKMNKNGAWVDITDPNKRVRVTDTGGKFLTDQDRAQNVKQGNLKSDFATALGKTAAAQKVGSTAADKAAFAKKSQAYLQAVAKQAAKKKK